jgi:hypothetical protein
MAMLIRSFGVPVGHRQDACAGLPLWSNRQAQATDPTLMALGGGLQ